MDGPSDPVVSTGIAILCFAPFGLVHRREDVVLALCLLVDFDRVPDVAELF